MIACLGWGSLTWDPRELGVGEWHTGGPAVNVEFVRQSGGDRLTLVLHGDAAAVPSLWARMTVDRLDAAVRDLARREKTLVQHIDQWSAGDPDPPNIAGLGAWATRQGVDGVIWTALGPKFDDEDGRVPTADQAVAYYVRRAPVDTVYRRRILHALGWEPDD